MVTAFALAACGFAPLLGAQTPSGATLDEAHLLALYVARHAATVEFADLAAKRASDGSVRKSAATLAQAHQEAGDKLRKTAADRHLTLVPPQRDTTAILLARATDLLRDKTGRVFDSTWVSLASDWLMTLLLDNNNHVKPLLSDPGLQSAARSHTTWLFHQLGDMAPLKKKFT